MSYHSWTVDGFGFCVDDIPYDTLTIEKILNLASMNEKLFKNVREYLDEICKEEDITYDDLTIDDLDELEGDYGDRGLTHILLNVIKDIHVMFTDDYEGVPYILYAPKYPWGMSEEEKSYTKEDVIAVFEKYIKILTDVPVQFDYYCVENGG